MKLGKKFTAKVFAVALGGLLALFLSFNYSSTAAEAQDTPSVPTVTSTLPEKPTPTTMPPTREITQDEYNYLVKQGDVVSALNEGTDATRDQTDTIYFCAVFMVLTLVALGGIIIIVAPTRSPSSK